MTPSAPASSARRVSSLAFIALSAGALAVASCGRTQESRRPWAPGGRAAELSRVATETAGVGGLTPLQVMKTALGDVIADPAKHTLYIFDVDDTGVSNCYGGCARQWPPMLVAANVTTVEAPLAIITRRDGTRQLAYGGRPLYRWYQDAAPGETKGEGVGGVWHVAKP